VNKSIRETQKDIKKAGFKILDHSITKKHHHYLLIRKGKEFKLIVSGTPSDYRGKKNMMAVLKRN